MLFIKPQEILSEVVSIEKLTHKVSVFRLKVPGDLEFRAGQFANVIFMNPDDPGEELQRAYSIANRHGEGEIEFCIEFVPGGRGSRFFEQLQVGDMVKMRVPFGMCYLKDHNMNDLIMVATGTGIAPIKSILEDLADKNDKRKIDLYFGVRYEDELFYLDELEELASRLDLKLNYCISQPKAANEWLTGRVTKYLPECDLSNDPDVYICGNGHMIKDVRDMFIEKGVEKKKIHVEIFDL